MDDKKLLNVLGEKELLKVSVKDSLVQTLSNNNLIDSISDLVNYDVWELIQEIIWKAEVNIWDLYIVGGIVRDLFFAKKNKEISIQDIDLVVDGKNSSFNVAAGIELAKILKQRHPEASLTVHHDFKTASLFWDKGALKSSDKAET